MKFSMILALAAFLVVAACSDNSSDPNTNDNQNNNNNGGNKPDPSDPNRVPPGSSKYLVRITHLYPFPYGREDNNESIDLRNYGPVNISMMGWKVRDNDSAVWDMSPIGMLSRDEKAFYKCLTPAQMDNLGDTLFLIDNVGDTIQTVAYDTVAQGQYILP